MKTIQAVWKDGQIVPVEPVDWPEGTPLSVEPQEPPLPDEPEGDLLGNDPESIARWIAYLHALPPLEMTEAEETEWQAAREEVKAYTIKKMYELSFEDQP